ncbi:MAG: hypothetical protein QOD83_1861 [Solirubrobacteraceae bacterium]|jgi:hypothetical protein|nr:hypothetical protein [Solirubrobacteraceae bacterium]
MIQLPIAHAGHWAVNLLYVLPLVVAVGALMTQSWRDKRHEKAEARADKPADAPPAR